MTKTKRSFLRCWLLNCLWLLPLVLLGRSCSRDFRAVAEKPPEPAKMKMLCWTDQSVRPTRFVCFDGNGKRVEPR